MLKKAFGDEDTKEILSLAWYFVAASEKSSKYPSPKCSLITERNAQGRQIIHTPIKQHHHD